mmetsp:Transcript_52477/g.122038  ORF Transcript_52477/g.122038 Transcript_52477/m.122038 type:complete len:171 (-) Transcript_52477:46-558(-)
MRCVLTLLGAGSVLLLSVADGLHIQKQIEWGEVAKTLEALGPFVAAGDATAVKLPSQNAAKGAVWGNDVFKRVQGAAISGDNSKGVAFVSTGKGNGEEHHLLGVGYAGAKPTDAGGLLLATKTAANSFEVSGAVPNTAGGADYVSAKVSHFHVPQNMMPDWARQTAIPKK